MAISSAWCGGSSDLKSMPKFCLSESVTAQPTLCVLVCLGDGASSANCVVTSHALK